MTRDWHCPEGCTGVGLYQGACPDDLGPDEPCINGILDDEEYKASEDPRFTFQQDLTKQVFRILDQDEEELQTMVDFNKLRAGRDKRDQKVQQRAGAIKPLPRSFVVIDFETTGFDRINDRIIEIGAVRFTEGEPVAIFNTLVKQTETLRDEVTKITGHTTEDIQKGLTEQQAFGVLFDFIGAATLVGHNVLFDYEFYHRALERLFCEPPRHDLIDTLTISRERSGYPHKLPDMCKKYNVPQNDWHSAYFDALACGQLLLALHAEDNKYPEGKQVADYINVLGWKRQYGEPTWAPSWTTLKGQGDIHVQEGPKKQRQVINPRATKPTVNHHAAGNRWFGESCPYQVCQYEEHDAQGIGIGYPVVVFCNHPDALQDELPHESNCKVVLCPMMTEGMKEAKRIGLDDDIPF